MCWPRVAKPAGTLQNAPQRRLAGLRLGKLPSPDGGGEACEQDVPLPVAEIVQEWVMFEPNGVTEGCPVLE